MNDETVVGGGEPQDVPPRLPVTPALAPAVAAGPDEEAEEDDDLDDDDEEEDDLDEDEDDDLDEDEDEDDLDLDEEEDDDFVDVDWAAKERVTDIPVAKLEALLAAALECSRANGQLPTDPAEAHTALFESGGYEFLDQYNRTPHSRFPWHRETVPV